MALPYGTTEEYQNIKPELVNFQKEENLSERIIACLYVDLKVMKEYEDLIAAGHREAELKYGQAIMSGSCACLLQMY